MSDEHHCREALAILVDCVQLCKIIRGEAESCTFNSGCAETFTAVVMQHLCCQDPAESIPSRFLQPVIESELTNSTGTRVPQTAHGGNSGENAELNARLMQLEEVGSMTLNTILCRVESIMIEHRPPSPLWAPPLTDPGSITPLTTGCGEEG